MAFRDLTDVLGVTPSKVLPIHGVEVEFPARISARGGQLLIAMQRLVEQDVTDVDEMMSRLELDESAAVELEQELFGDGAAILDEMGVVGAERAHIGQTLTVWHLAGQEDAERVWEGKAMGPSRAARRVSKPKAGPASKTGGTARARSRAAGGASSASRTRRRT